MCLCCWFSEIFQYYEILEAGMYCSDNSIGTKKMNINFKDIKCIITFNYLTFFQHYLKVHAEKNYVCDRCGKSFSTESAKKGHTRVCGVEFTCSCSKTYITYEALLTHAKRSLHTITEKYKNSIDWLETCIYWHSKFTAISCNYNNGMILTLDKWQSLS